MELTIEQFFSATEDKRNPIGLPFTRTLDQLEDNTNRNLKQSARTVLVLIKANEVLTYELLCVIFKCKADDLAAIIYKTRKQFQDAGYKLIGDRYFECYNVKVLK